MRRGSGLINGKLQTYQMGDTLPVVDTTAIVKDPADATKKVRLDAGAVATATTRTITMPDSDVNLALVGGSFVGQAQAPQFTGDTTGTLGVGLKAYWPAKDSGNTLDHGALRDIIGSRVLRPSGAIPLVAGGPEGVLHDLAATYYYLDAANDEFYGSGEQSFTFAAWVKTGSTYLDVNRLPFQLAKEAPSNDWLHWMFYTGAAANNKLAWQIRTEAVTYSYIESTDVVTNSTLQLFAGQLDAAGNLAGVSLNGHTWETVACADMESAQDPLLVLSVGRGLTDGGLLANMAVGNIALWSRAISNAEIAAYYNAGSGVQIVRHI